MLDPTCLTNLRYRDSVDSIIYTIVGTLNSSLYSLFARQHCRQTLPLFIVRDSHQATFVPYIVDDDPVGLMVDRGRVSCLDCTNDRFDTCGGQGNAIVFECATSGMGELALPFRGHYSCSCRNRCKLSAHDNAWLDFLD